MDFVETASRYFEGASAIRERTSHMGAWRTQEWRPKVEIAAALLELAGEAVRLNQTLTRIADAFDSVIRPLDGAK